MKNIQLLSLTKFGPFKKYGCNELLFTFFAGKRKNKHYFSSSTSSTSSRLSTDHFKGILDRLKMQKNRSSTQHNYYGIWKNFNEFVIKLDRRPSTWEEKFSLFGAYLVDKGIQSSTFRSYASALKAVLTSDGYEWDDQKVPLNTIIKACKLKNDVVKTRLPISCNLLELILMQVNRQLNAQPYLCIMYKCIFLLGYYGLLRVGELVTGSHPIKAAHIHLGENKDKILIILYSSKNTWKSCTPTGNKNRIFQAS